MPVKQKNTRKYHQGKDSERHGKAFLKVYAPYLPLILIVGFGLFLSTTNTFKKHTGVLAYAINTTDNGLLDATNKERLSRGLNPLKLNTRLDLAAQSKATDMKNKNYWSHNTPDGKEPWAFIDQAGYSYYKAAENLAYGFSNSKDTVVGWMNSPSHRDNLLDPELSEVGFGIINAENYIGKGPQTIIVAEYGTPSYQSILGSSDNANESAHQNTANSVSQLPAKKISYAQMLTKGSAPWITFAVGLILGLGVMYLFLKHARNLLLTIKNGEKFVLHHPLLDTTIVALLALATIVFQTAGMIH